MGWWGVERGRDDETKVNEASGTAGNGELKTAASHFDEGWFHRSRTA
jgi:hypothetical protein